MASIADIREKRKFFIRKKNFDPKEVCEICKNHDIILAVKISCDYFIFSDLQATNENLRNRQALHVWCRTMKMPPCFRSYKDAGFVE